MMLNKIFLALLSLCAPLAAQTPSLPSHPSIEEFKDELGLKTLPVDASATTCKLYLVQHGSTEWSEIKRLQGWNEVSLSQNGKEQIEKLAKKISSLNISAIYASSLKSAVESGMILKERLVCPLIIEPALRGEFHGEFEGFYRNEYEKHPHFQFYNSLSPEEEIFFPCGQGGESKADVVRRAFPVLKKISEEHLGENVVVITHGAVFKVLNYYVGNYPQEAGTIGIAYGEAMCIEGDANSLYLRH